MRIGDIQKTIKKSYAIWKYGGYLRLLGWKEDDIEKEVKQFEEYLDITEWYK